MIRLTFDDKNYKINTLFEEITIKELHAGYEYLQKAPIGMLSYLKDKSAEVEPTKLLDFQINWVALFSNIPLDVLKMITPTGEEGEISVEAVYNMVEKFVYTPENYYNLPNIKLGKESFELVKELTTISGAKMFFSSGTYNQFKLSNMLAGQIKETKTPSTAECLVQMCAVLYTKDGNNSDEEIDRKINLFWELDSATCWSAYFFFAQLQSKWSDFFHSYTGKTTQRKEAKAKQMMAKERLRKAYKKTIIGKLWNWKSANSMPLIMAWKV
jgi:hypothetical protein